MASIVVRNISDEVMDRLKHLASSHNRSVEAEVRNLIDSSTDLVAQARKLQDQLKGRKLTPSIELLRDDRDR